MNFVKVNPPLGSDGVTSLNSLTGILTIIGTSGISVSDNGSSVITISQSDLFYIPVDARAVSGNILPDTDALYDLGNAGVRFRDIHAVSGSFDEVTINGVYHSTLPPIIYSIQASGGPVDARAAAGHIVPDTNSIYDLGIPALRMRLIAATSGDFNNAINLDNAAIIKFGGDPFIRNWEANSALAIGKDAGADVASCNHVGKLAGGGNAGDYCNSFGHSALRNNNGASCNSFGHSALRNNNGASCNSFGHSALQNNNGAGNTAFGHNAFNTWTDDTGAAKTCTSGNFTVATQRVVVTGHSFGSAGTYVNLKISTDGTLPAGLTAGIDQWKIIDANTLQVITDSFTDGGSGTHTLTPPVTYSNSTALGQDAEPTASNQVMLGDTNVTEVKTKGKYTMAAAAVEARIEKHTETEPRFVPSVTESGMIGTPTAKWREVHAMSGIFDSKSFVIPHPTMPDKSIKYTCPEGPEYGVYCRGKGTLVNGKAVIRFNGEFEHVVRAESITIQLTPKGKAACLFYDNVSKYGFEVGGEVLGGGEGDVGFSWRAEGTRQDKPVEHDTVIARA